MRLLTVQEAAERLSLSPKTVRFWIWTRKIEIVKLGRSVRIREDMVAQMIEQATIPGKAELVGGISKNNAKRAGRYCREY